MYQPGYTPQSPALGVNWRQQLRTFVDNPLFSRVIIVLILINAVTLGLETSPAIMASHGGVITAIDRLILAIFIAEIGLRMLAYGLRFFRDPWSMFDFAVVAIALVPASSEFSVLRALRVLRVLRLVSMVPQMRRVVGALLASIPGLSSIILVLMLIFYVFAVIATNLFAQEHPQWFGSIGASMYTLFQIMTLESWSMGIVRPLMETHPQAWAFFVPFILISTFTILNLFIAIIVNAMQSQAEQEEQPALERLSEQREQSDQRIARSLQRLENEIAGLREAIAEQRQPDRAGTDRRR